MLKLVYFNHNPFTDRHTYIHTYIDTYNHTYKHSLRLKPHQRPLRLHDYEPHAKAFGNNTYMMVLDLWSPIGYKLIGFSHPEFVYTR